MWDRDRNGVWLQRPENGNDHCFVGDTLIWTEHGKKKIKDLVGTSGYLWSRDKKLCKYENVRITRRDVDVVTLEFNDGQKLSVTEDHLLLRPDGTWIEAGLLRPSDMIQSVTYDKDNSAFQWSQIYPTQWGKIFKQWKQKDAQICVGSSEWGDTERASHTPQGQQPAKQRHNQFRIKDKIRAFIRSLDTRKTRASESEGFFDTTTYKEMAWVKRGEGVALTAWEEYICQKKTSRKGVRSLSQKLFYNAIGIDCEVLPPELQNERPTKTVIGITRGRSEIVYNLDVEETHCLWADGVIAHNCIDGCRYFLQRHLKKNQNDTKEFYDKLKMKQFGYKFASAPRNKPRAGLR
jgi:hypothetical protein